jgi:hypothetical protein
MVGLAGLTKLSSYGGQGLTSLVGSHLSRGVGGSRQQHPKITIKDGRTHMFNMTDDQHRHNTVTGFRALADFLAEFKSIAPLNTASRIDVQYSILEEDDDKAREEYRELVHFMGDAVKHIHAEFSAASHVYDDATHHTARLTFGAGTVSYTALWIERKEDNDNGN